MSDYLRADSYVEVLAQEYHRKYAFRAQSSDELYYWQQHFRAALAETLGIPTIAARGISKLDPEQVAETQLEDHIREEWRLTSEPGYYVPFFVLRPLQQQSPLPVVITPHGHGKAGKNTYAGIANNNDEREQINEGERDIALQAVRQGYVAIAPDVRAFAGKRLRSDIDQDKTSSCRTMQMHALLFGRTLIGERVFDTMRLIDYAQTRPEVDASKVIVTGNSGGGTVSLHAAALDTRISMAIPGCYFSTYAASIGAIYHCECNYIPGILQLGEMYDVAGLIAPRPFLAVAGRDDPIFPIDSVMTSFARLQEIYRIAEAADRCELFIGAGGHRYYQERVWPFVRQWLNAPGLA